LDLGESVFTAIYSKQEKCVISSIQSVHRGLRMSRFSRFFEWAETG